MRWYCFISWGCDFYLLSEGYKAFLNFNLRHPNWQPGALSCPFYIRLYIWKAFLLTSSCIKQSLVNVWSLEVLLCKNYFLLLVMLSDPIPCIIHVSHSESIRQTSGTQENAYEFENGYGVIADVWQLEQPNIPLIPGVCFEYGFLLHFLFTYAWCYLLNRAVKMFFWIVSETWVPEIISFFHLVYNFTYIFPTFPHFLYNIIHSFH